MSKDLLNSVDDDLLDMLKDDDSYERKLEEDLDSYEDDESDDKKEEDGATEQEDVKNKKEEEIEKKGKINMNLITSGRETSKFSFNDKKEEKQEDEADDDSESEESVLNDVEDIGDVDESVLTVDIKEEFDDGFEDEFHENSFDSKIENIEIHESLSDDIGDEIVEKESFVKTKAKEYAHLAILFIVAAVFGSLITMVLLSKNDDKTPFTQSVENNMSDTNGKGETIVKTPVKQEVEEESVIVDSNSLVNNGIGESVEELVTPDVELSAKEAIIQAVQIVNHYESQMSNYTQDEIMTINKYIRGDTSRILIKNKLSSNISRKNQVLADFQDFESFFTYVGLGHLYQNTEERLEAHLFFEEELLSNAFSKGELRSEVDRIISNDEKYSTKQMEIIESVLIHNDLKYEKRSGKIIIK